MSERRPYMYSCGVPGHACSGQHSTLNAGLRDTSQKRVHNTPEAAFRCHKNYLISIGYELVGSRELRAPDGSGIRVLTKPSRFGARLRNGKEGTRNMSNTKIRGGGRRSGNIASY